MSSAPDQIGSAPNMAEDGFPCLQCGESSHGCYRDTLTGHWHCFKGVSRDETGESTANDATAEAAQQSGPCITKLADVRAERIHWLWPGRIALGKLTLIAGDPGLGKSFLTLELASRVSTGKGWPDDPATTYSPSDVILLGAEDDLSDTIRPRLNAAGADSQRISAITGIRDLDDAGNQAERMADVSRDLRHIESAIESLQAPRLLIIDPISAYLGDVDSHKNTEVRAALAPLSDLASKYQVAIVGVTHLRKGEGKAIHRAMGSLAFVAAARTVWAVTRDEYDDDRRLLLPVKNNIGNDREGMAFSLDDTGRPAAAVTWEAEPIDMTADDAIGHSKPGPEPSARQQAEQWLREQLAGGPRPQKEIEEHAEAEGHSKATLRRAKNSIGAKAYQPEKPGPWYWRLGAPDTPDAHPSET
jgi:hypothetical protein